MKDQLLAKINDRSAVVGVVGLGYVGLPLAVEFAKAGFHVVGYDVSTRVVSILMGGKSHIQDVPSAEVAARTTAPLCRFFAWIGASATGVPVGPVTIPVNVPPAPCAKRAVPTIRSAATVANWRMPRILHAN